MAMRCATRDLDRQGRDEARRSSDRVTAGSAAARAARRGRGDPHLHRRADAGTAPTPCSCRRTCAPRAAPSSCRPGLKRGANRRLAGEDVRKRRGRAAGRPAARRAGRGARRRARPDRTRRCGGACGSRCSRPATRSSSRARRGPPPALYDANRYLLDGLLDRLGAEVTDLGILRDDPDALDARDRRRGARPRPGADLRRRLDRRSRSCARRGREDRQAGVLARRDQAGTAGGDGRDPGPAATARRSSACRAIRSRRS